MFDSIKKSLQTINYKLWLSIISMMLLPTIYLIVRVHFLGDMPTEYGFNIASQLSWVNIIYEIVDEALLLPLFYLLGKYVSDVDKTTFENRVKTSLLLTFLIYLVLSILITIFAKPLTMLMAQERQLIDATVTYIRLESIGKIVAILVKLIGIVFILLNRYKYLYIILSAQMFLSIIFDTFLISSLPISLKIGVNGIAISNIVTNIIILIISLSILSHKEGINIFSRDKLSFKWYREWRYVGFFSGLESLIRNIAFMIMILRMVNLVSEQGTYWVANNFIWNLLLVPALALGDLIKKEVGEDRTNIESKTFGYINITVVISILWLLTIPLWKPFLNIFMNIKDYEKVFMILLIQTPAYITFMFNLIMDSTFYGFGKTKYMLYQSICIDIIYYGIFFILYLNKIFVPTLISISIMFSMGMILDLIPAIILYRKLLKDNNLKIGFFKYS